MLVEVALPEISMDSLTYESSIDLKEGVRVIIEVGRTKRTGFILGESKKEIPLNVKIKPVEGIIDEVPVIDADVWDLALWSARVSMCGNASALKAALPVQVYTGSKVNPPPEIESASSKFIERNCFNPLDSERVNFFLTELESNQRILILFPKKDEAKAFYSILPENLKSEAALWISGSPKLWETWTMIQSRKARIVVAGSGGVFAPLMPQKIIVEDEANPSYVIPYSLNLSARSLAGHRAAFLKAEFITAGRIPSLKTYRRTKPREILRPERKNIILADIHRSRKEEINGIKGSIPLTYALTNRTHQDLAKGRNVIWILNRSGESSEVFCENCGESVRCPKCGGLMQARNDGEILKCRRCGMLLNLPPKCVKCGCPFLAGKRPGIEALAKIAGKYFPEVHVFVEGMSTSGLHGLILSGHRGLELCGKINPSLVAWLDLDSELWQTNHNNRFNVFSMLLESYWRGRENDSERKLLIQARRSGMRLAEMISRGWGKFIPDELKMRYEFMLPPYGYIIEVECSSKILRGEILNLFMKAGIFVMDPGNESNTLFINTESLDDVRKILEPKIFLRNTKTNYINITVRSE